MNTIYFFKKISLKIALSSTFLMLSHCVLAQNKVVDSTKVNELKEVLVSAVRASSKTPIPFSSISKSEIEKQNLGQDIPILLNFLPAVVTTSDAGNGFGYTSIRVRGSDSSRLNVTLNGIPFNDSESQGTYFVDMPDFASSIESVQLQRGVGTSTNGAGAFGASLNLQTNSFLAKPMAEIAASIGSFNSRKTTLKFSSGLIANHFEIDGRLSKLYSDGYVDRAFSDLKSFFVQGNYINKNTLIKFISFGGHEKTYQAWYGVDAETLAKNPSYNFAGQYVDDNGNTQFYENQTDNYTQNHFQLHWNQKITLRLKTNFALHFTKGKGYYEEYKVAQNPFDFDLTPIAQFVTTDLITRKWLDNDFFGFTFSGIYNSKNTEIVFGGALNQYKGKNYGEVIWAKSVFVDTQNQPFYNYFGNKTDGNIFAKINYKWSKKWQLFGDFQTRNIRYEADGVQNGQVSKNYTFLNPKAGVNFDLDQKNSFYGSYSRANREPNRTDFENGNPVFESLDDFELGWRYATKNIKLNSNLYVMNYQNQLVKTGELDSVGNEIRANVAQSYRTGIEFDTAFMISKNFDFIQNCSFSQSKISKYIFGEATFENTNIAFSPNVVASSILNFKSKTGLEMAVAAKYVGQQFAGNFDLESTKLKAYSVLDFNFNYTFETKKICKSIVFTGVLHNFLNTKYVSNAYLYGDSYMSYFPQAGINFMVGLDLKF